MYEKESLAGRVLSHYELVEEIGRGGMGVVYRARDQKLRREVAIKVLPERLVSDKERVKRFEREALALAKLNHPNVATIHELAEHEGERFLVLELVPGEDLAERLSRGPLSTSEALSCFHQITRALEVAHDQGIVHRDLKPANVRITPDGTVKVLDFGLARPFEVEAPADLSQSPTLTKDGTATGVLVGTPFYMSPEQARGKVVDSRTDIWAFGCALYEALTGKLAFPGETVSDTIAAILEKEPDWTALPEETPPSIRTLLRRCLRTDPRKRLHHIADARLEIEDAIDGIGSAPVPVERRSTPRWVPLVAAGALVASASVGYFFRGDGEGELRRFSILAPEGTVLAHQEWPAISPDGRLLAFVAEDDSGERELWIRPLDRETAQPLPGTKGARKPFWSPDSESIGFFSEGKLRRVASNGGNLRDLADVERSHGGTWGPNGVILFTPRYRSGLYRVSAEGGPVEPVTKLDATQFGHGFPVFLPDGRRFLYRGAPTGKKGIHLGSLDSPGEPHRFLLDSIRVAYAPPGYLVFQSEGWLMAQRFDPREAVLEGEPFPLLENRDPMSAWGSFSVSETGVLVYARTDTESQVQRLVWYDREGRELGTLGEPAAYASPAISPDGTRVAFDYWGGGDGNVWVWSGAENAPFPLTSGPRTDRFPVWSPDGKSVLFTTGGGGRDSLFRKVVGGESAPELLLSAETDGADPIPKFPTDWTADGRYLVYFEPKRDQTGDYDIWVLPLFGDRNPRPIVRTDDDEFGGTVSPDGRWLAFGSIQEEGVPQVYVQRFPDDTGPVRVSDEGGREPRWRSDGKELFYLTLDGAVAAVDVDTTGGSFRPGLPGRLFQTKADLSAYTRNRYDTTSDGERFLVVEPVDLAPSREIHVVLNWEALGRTIGRTIGRE